MTSDAIAAHTIAVANAVGCKASSRDKILSCLRSVLMDQLLKAATEYAVGNFPPMGLFTFLPSVNGDILPDRPSILLRRGQFGKGEHIHL